MTELRFENFRMEAAELGEENCLPDILNNKYIHAKINTTENLTEQDCKWIGKGMIGTMLPYCILDGYTRERKPTDFPAAVLENEYLKAVFLPTLGGRLWSLVDKKSGRELLYKNDVFQPANLSLRNAWFSGGVEWNVGIKGHNPLTCSPLFACRCTNKHGQPVLKMYEYERIRGVVYTVCATLKDDVLLVHPIIENTEDTEKFMYWWSNIAVDEEEGLRILTPAKESFVSFYDENVGYILDCCPLPVMQVKGMEQPVDVSYPDRIFRSGDFFHKIPDERKKWIAAVNQSGAGMAQFSDDILQGRKLFVWGRQQGGRHWNEWLSDDYKPYVEIQAGLLKTQMEHFLMDGNSVIEWTEGYCAVQGAPEMLHQKDYEAAAATVEERLADKFALLQEGYFDIVSQNAPCQLGSGWGAVESLVRGEKISHINDFPVESIDEVQADWIALLNTGKLPEHDVNAPVASYVAGEFWEKKLRENVNETWYDYYQLGCICCGSCRFEDALAYFKRSNEIRENPWALRNIAQIQKNHLGATTSAAENMLRAIALKPDYRPLLWDCADALIAERRYADWLAVCDNMDEFMRGNGRIRFYMSFCMVKLGQLEEAARILTKDLVVNDLKEGEYSVSHLWIELYRLIMAGEQGIAAAEISDEMVLKAYPLPYELDFRMH